MSRTKKTESAKKYCLQEEFKPKTKNQAEYVRAIIDSTVTFCTGPAGSGKTLIPVALASQLLLEDRFEKIVVTRPAIEASPKGIGFLPGDYQSKTLQYMVPCVEYFVTFLGEDRYFNFIRDKRITFETCEFLRGRTFKDSFILVDETQNCSYEQIKMILTRIGENSKIVLTGDVEQADIKIRSSNNETDLQIIINKLKKYNSEEISFIEMTESDILRNPLIAHILRALK